MAKSKYRWHIKGDQADLLECLRERLDEHSIPEALTGCTICWLAGADGYPYIRVPGVRKLLRANRAIWLVLNGPIPEEMLVCHKCDNRACVNIDHLYLGTHKDNARDMDQRGRRNCVAPKGSNNGNAKINERDVADILSDPRFYSDIAETYSVSTALIAQIKTRRIWTHVEEPIGGVIRMSPREKEWLYPKGSRRVIV